MTPTITLTRAEFEAVRDAVDFSNNDFTNKALAILNKHEVKDDNA